MAGTPTPGDVQHAQARRRQDAAEQAELKARRRAEHERNRAAKLARQARLALPPEQRLADLASRAAAIEARWTMPPAQVDPAEVKAAQRAAMTRVEVVEVVREITVEVPAPPLAPGSYTECEVCVGRGMRDRYGQVPAAAERLALVDTTGAEVAVIETCPTHTSFVRATAQQRGFTTRSARSARSARATPGTAAARP
ncbi:hypothetical protein [Streptomyces sp. NPDC005012]|uniref:hypothetical protein n=1 Tax=Streptomyces sp. NPDC005012 TaxID=3154558 RepID=UPI0033B9188F